MKSQIMSAIKTSMKSGEKEKVLVLRTLLSAIKDEEIKQRKEDLPTQTVYSIIKKLIKQRCESIECYKNANRLDLLEIEEFEKEVLEKYLPSQMSETDTKTLVSQVIAELKVSSLNDMGKVMKEIKSKNIDNIDMGLVNKFVKEVLA